MSLFFGGAIYSPVFVSIFRTDVRLDREYSIDDLLIDFKYDLNVHINCTTESVRLINFVTLNEARSPSRTWNADQSTRVFFYSTTSVVFIYLFILTTQPGVRDDSTTDHCGEQDKSVEKSCKTFCPFLDPFLPLQTFAATTQKQGSQVKEGKPRSLSYSLSSYPSFF